MKPRRYLGAGASVLFACLATAFTASRSGALGIDLSHVTNASRAIADVVGRIACFLFADWRYLFGTWGFLAVAFGKIFHEGRRNRNKSTKGWKTYGWYLLMAALLLVLCLIGRAFC